MGVPTPQCLKTQPSINNIGGLINYLFAALNAHVAGQAK